MSVLHHSVLNNLFISNQYSRVFCNTCKAIYSLAICCQLEIQPWKLLLWFHWSKGQDKGAPLHDTHPPHLSYHLPLNLLLIVRYLWGSHACWDRHIHDLGYWQIQRMLHSKPWVWRVLHWTLDIHGNPRSWLHEMGASEKTPLLLLCHIPHRDCQVLPIHEKCHSIAHWSLRH